MIPRSWSTVITPPARSGWRRFARPGTSRRTRGARAAGWSGRRRKRSCARPWAESWRAPGAAGQDLNARPRSVASLALHLETERADHLRRFLEVLLLIETEQRLHSAQMLVRDFLS